MWIIVICHLNKCKHEKKEKQVLNEWHGKESDSIGSTDLISASKQHIILIFSLIWNEYDLLENMHRCAIDSET